MRLSGYSANRESAVFVVHGYSAFNLKRKLYGYDTQLAVPSQNGLTLRMQSSRTKFLRQENSSRSGAVRSGTIRVLASANYLGDSCRRINGRKFSFTAMR